MELKLKAYAKINAYLSIGERLPVKSSFGNRELHTIATIIQNIDLYDEFLIKKTGSNIEIFCDKIAPSGKDNIAYKALNLLKTKYGIGGLKVWITKNIPACAGLGGGSSNAAAVLKAAIKLFDLPVKRTKLLKIAHEVGSDVPFFIVGGCAHVSGTGDIVEKTAPIFTEDHIIVIAKPVFSISSKDAYVAIDEMVGKSKIKKPQNINLKNCWNDFEDWALNKYRELVRIKELAEECGALSNCLTGSGSAVFAIFEDRQKAESFKDLLKNEKFIDHVFTTKAIGESMRYLN